jgi:AAA+ ATPase superfamily predicted ATPase
MKFYNREPQLAELHRIQELAFKDYSKMTVVTGRRRVGKTSLIIHALSNDDQAKAPAAKTPTVYLFVSRKSEGALCRDFAEEASRALDILVPYEINSFGRMFRFLMETGVNRPFNLVIDEFQEFDYVNRSLFSDIQNYWDQYRKKSKVNLLISGSVYSLMNKIFKNSKEPLFGRADNILTLKPFPPSVLKEIMRDNYPAYTNDDLLALYSFTGGVPKYIEQFCDQEALSLPKMIDFMAREDSPSIDEGRNLLINEIGKNYGVYFSILAAVSGGATAQNTIEDRVGEVSISGHIKRLIENYQILTRRRPLLAKEGSHTVRYEIEDNFLHFWFAYFEKYRSLIEIGNIEAVHRKITDSYTNYSGLMLERYFKKHLAETKEFMDIGSWWEAKGNENQIDIIALKLEKNQALAVEVKRKQENFRISKLEEKVEHLKAKAMPNYEFELKCLSLDDM